MKSEVNADRKNYANAAVRNPALPSRINFREQGDAVSSIVRNLFSSIFTFDISRSNIVRQLCNPVIIKAVNYSFSEGIIIATRHQNAISSF